MVGRLSLVGTPIGNLGDITLRAVEALKDADRIYAEDTRRSRTLLSHLGIEGKRLVSLHAHSTERAIGAAVEVLMSGENVALVTDAGMPGVSDPGAELVRAAQKAKIEVTVLPGPSAVTAAVALSGLVDGPFTFLGFLPRKGLKRIEALKHLSSSAEPQIFFESPHRIKGTLNDLLEVCGPTRRVALCREITKKFEETLLLPLSELAAPEFRELWQGEFTLVVEKSPTPGQTDQRQYDLDERARQLLQEGHSVKSVATTLCNELTQRGKKTSRRDLYARVLALTESEN